MLLRWPQFVTHATFSGDSPAEILGQGTQITPNQRPHLQPIRCCVLQINEYIPYNINGGEKELLKQILYAEMQKSKSGESNLPGGLQRLSHLPTDYVRKVFIYFRRFGSLNN